MKFDVKVDVMNANGQGGTNLMGQLMANGVIDPGMKKPWLDPTTGMSYLTVFSGGDPLSKASYITIPSTNATATLRKDEWKAMDMAVLKVAQSRLRGVADLQSRGLTYNIGNGMAYPVFQYEDIDSPQTAFLTMDGNEQGQYNRPNYDIKTIPLPICHVDYQINERVLSASRNIGQSLDTAMAEGAARAVAEKLENMLFTDTTYGYGGGTIYSYLNHPNRNLKTISTTWTNSAMTGALIVEDVLAMKQQSINAHHYGPWVMYIPVTYETKMDEDYSSTKGSNTIRERLKAIEGISDIKVIDTLPTDNVLLVEMTSDVVRWINGMPIQNVQWDLQGGMTHHYKVMTIQVPQIRADQKGNSGLVHGSV